MATCGVYKITSPSNRTYIGSSINIEDRWRDYKGLDCKKQRRLYASFKKYGIDKHTFEIILKTDFDILLEKERELGLLYDCLGENGLNCYLPDIGEKKRITSEETRNIIRLERTGRKHTQETKDKISESKIGSIPYNKGVFGVLKSKRKGIPSGLKGIKQPSKHKSVLMFDVNGNFIREFSAFIIASEELKIDHRKISNNANGYTKKVKINNEYFIFKHK